MNKLDSAQHVASAPTRNSRSGRYFTIHIPTVMSLIDRGITPEDLMAYFILAAGTESSNTLTRSGRKAIATGLNCGIYAAGQAVMRLIKIGAIVSLEDDLENRRDPTATRFRLPLLGEVSIGQEREDGTGTASSVARLPNSLVQDRIEAANLCRAIRVGRMPVLTTLLKIAIDPAQISWPPEIHAAVPMKPLGRLGAKTVASLDLIFGMTDGLGLQFNFDHDAVLLLAESGILCFDVYTATPSYEGGDLTMLDPLATIWRGSVSLTGPNGRAAILSFLAARIVQNPGDPLPNREALLAEFRLGAQMVALLPGTMSDAQVILRPRLTTLPHDPETVEAERRLVSAGRAAAQNILGLFMQNLPDIAPYAKALVTAVRS